MGGNRVEQGKLLDLTRLQTVDGGTGEHAVGRAGIDRLEASKIEELALLDTIPEHPDAARARIKYLTVAPMFAEAIERTYQEISIAKLFT
jgi:ribose-phosphate pyrophosphokinase